MKKIIFTSAVIISFLLTGCKCADSETSVKKLLGIWEYTVPDAPYEYQTGSMTFEKVNEEQLSGFVMINEYRIDLVDIVVDKDNANFHLYIQGEKISFDLSVKKNSLSGIVSSSEGDLDISAKKNTEL